VKLGTCQKPKPGTKIGASMCLYARSCHCFFFLVAKIRQNAKKKQWLVKAYKSKIGLQKFVAIF
jgi:hypothetical protein